MAEDFRGPYLKLRRAEEHISYLQPLLQRFMDSHGYEAVPDLQSEPGFVLWVVRGAEQFPHDIFSPIIGDIVHNLRSSLDVAMSILMRNAGKSDAGVQFPTGGSLDHFKNIIGKGMEAPKPGKARPEFPSGVIDVLETRIQPYKGGHAFGGFLRALHILSIMDKHRLIAPTVFGMRIVTLQDHPGQHVPILVFEDPIPIKNGTEIARYLVGSFPQFNLDQNARITLAIAFDERCGMLHKVEVSVGVQMLFTTTENALKELGTCL